MGALQNDFQKLQSCHIGPLKNRIGRFIPQIGHKIKKIDEVRLRGGGFLSAYGGINHIGDTGRRGGGKGEGREKGGKRL